MVKGFLAQAARPVKLKCEYATPLYFYFKLLIITFISKKT